MKTTLVVLKVADEDESRPWEKALGLPFSYRWDEHLPASVHATVVTELSRTDQVVTP